MFSFCLQGLYVRMPCNWKGGLVTDIVILWVRVEVHGCNGHMCLGRQKRLHWLLLGGLI